MVIELKELLEYLVAVAKERDAAIEEIGHLRSSLASAQQRLLMIQREQEKHKEPEPPLHERALRS